VLDLHSILWVIPGVIFIYFYNRFRPDNAKAVAIDLSGWPLIFCLVVIAVPTWFLAELIVSFCTIDTDLYRKSAILGLSIIFTFCLLLLAQIESIAEIVFLQVKDNFYKKCVEWENKEILLSLKNGKVYKGLLWKFPSSPKSRHESQTISIIPFESGYRNSETKKVIWDTNYPEYIGYPDLVDMEIIIPRSEIILFGKFSKKTFKHFEKQKKDQETNQSI